MSKQTARNRTIECDFAFKLTLKSGHIEANEEATIIRASEVVFDDLATRRRVKLSNLHCGLHGFVVFAAAD